MKLEYEYEYDVNITMSKENQKRVTFLVEEQSWEEAKANTEHGEMSQLLRERVNAVAHGEQVAEETKLTDRLRTLRETRREKRQERDSIESTIDEIDRKIERVEQRLDTLREQEGEYDGVLAMLEEDLDEGVRMIETSTKVKRAAAIGGCNTEDVINDLKERNPNIPDRAFRRPQGTEGPKWKTNVENPFSNMDVGE